MNSKHISSLLSHLNSRIKKVTSGNLRLPPAGVTLAIPNWNHEWFLPRSIRSALMAVAELKRYGVPGEVLVIDDHSRDGSPALLRQLEALYFEHGLRASFMPGNRGLPAVRNQALLKANYRYIVYLDADNEIVLDNLIQFYRAIQETGAAVVYGNLLCKEYGSDVAPYVYSNESFQARLFDTNYIDACALFDRAQIFDVGGYVSETIFPSQEDWELYLHLATNGRLVVFVPLIFGIYYINPGSMIQDSLQDSPLQEMIGTHFRRVFNQRGLRKVQKLNTTHLRYHPDIGYI